MSLLLTLPPRRSRTSACALLHSIPALSSIGEMLSVSGSALSLPACTPACRTLPATAPLPSPPLPAALHTTALPISPIPKSRTHTSETARNRCYHRSHGFWKKYFAGSHD